MSQPLLLESSSSLPELKARLSELIRFDREEDAVLCLLWAAQAQLGPDVLPKKCLFYLVFTGPKSSGKTTATELMTEIAGGRYLAGGTTASIRDILSGKPKALGIDEVDIRMKQIPELEGILRIGNKWDAPYSLRVVGKDGKWETSEQNVGGPKVMNYRNDPEDALSSRAIVVELAPCNDVELVIDGLFGDPKAIAIRDSMKKLALEAILKWDAAQVEDHMRSNEFKDRVRGLKTNQPRKSQVGAVLLAIGDILTWDVESAVRTYLSEERDDAFQVEREFMLEIYDEHSSEARDGILELPNAEVHLQMNNRLKKQGLRPLGRASWKRIRRELRIKDRRENVGLVLIFDADTREAIGA